MARPQRKISTAARTPAGMLPVTLALVGMMVTLLLSACGGGGGKTAPVTTQAQSAPAPALTGAAEHFADAQAALAKGNLTGPEGVRDHLEEAITASADLPLAKQHAENALKALAKGDRVALAKEIDEGLAAAKQAPPGAAKTTVDVSVGEFFIKPRTSSSTPGPVEFNVTNGGKVAHEFVVVKTDLAPDKLPTRPDGGADEEKAGVVPGELEDLGPGTTKRLRLSLKPGKYVFICNLPGHYAAGQRAGFTVG
jgi:uncharacterized cupredoxin-like copper-binding protein